MGLNEILGFFVILFILFFPLLRKLLVGKQAVEKPPSVEEEQVEEVMPQHPVVIPHSPTPLTQRLVKSDFSFHSQIEDRKLKERLKPKKMAPKKRKSSSIKALLQGRTPEETMVILSEVFGPPKSMQ